jgi:hypothetical protein
LPLPQYPQLHEQLAAFRCTSHEASPSPRGDTPRPLGYAALQAPRQAVLSLMLPPAMQCEGYSSFGLQQLPGAYAPLAAAAGVAVLNAHAGMGPLGHGVYMTT